MIFYFSCTGNTLWAARRLADATHEKLVNMASAGSQPAVRLQSGEPVGFCFPVHGWQPPHLVLDFISGLTLPAEGHYVYALCTCGDDIGQTMDLLSTALHRRGISLNARFSLVMPESYVGLPFMDVDSPENEQRKIVQARVTLRQIADRVATRTHGDWNLVKGPWPWLYTHVLGGFFHRWIVTDKPFRVDAALCIRCGLCARVCPVGDLCAQPGQLPRWQRSGKCMSCFACYHHCPRHAIAYGSRTRHKGQYFMKSEEGSI